MHNAQFIIKRSANHQRSFQKRDYSQYEYDIGVRIWDPATFSDCFSLILSPMVCFTMERRTVFALLVLCFMTSSHAFLSTQHFQQERFVTLVASLPTDEGKDGPTRREAIQFGALALSSLLLPGTLPAPAYSTEPKTIVLTGK